MKSMLSILFIVQLFITLLYGLLFFQREAFHSFLEDDVTIIEVNFGNYPYGLERFLGIAADHELDVSRIVFLDEETLIVYTTDLTLGNRVRLSAGRFPEEGSTEFVSNQDTGEDSQVGTMLSIIPEFRMAVSSIQSPYNFARDGLYYLHTTDSLIIEQLTEEVRTFASYFSVIQFRWFEDEPSISSFLFRYLGGLFRIVEFVMISVVMFLCMLFSSIHYGIKKLKSGSILKIHGFSNVKILIKIISDLTKLLLVSVVIAFVLSIAYSVYMGYHLFLREISLFFGMLSLLLIAIYVVVVCLVVFLSLLIGRSVDTIKGKKGHLPIQVSNHVLKIAFGVIFLVAAHFSLMNISYLNQRVSVSTYWDKTQDVYRIEVFSVGFGDWQGVGQSIAYKKEALFWDLSESHNAFIMNASHFHSLDRGFNPYMDPLNAPPLELSPNGYRVDISPNFLKINPIQAVNNIDVEEQIIWEDNTLNLLVPEHLRVYEKEITRLYLDDFYFRAVTVASFYMEDMEAIESLPQREDLRINIIFVESNQYYFSFDAWLRPETGGRILDPIAMIYTGSVHPEFLGALFTTSLFFHSSAIDAYRDIFPILYEHSLTSAIQRVAPVFDQNMRIILDLREQLFRSIIFIVILLFAGIAITYSTTVNYFEQKKYMLFVKRIFGYNIVKRNKMYVFTLLGYMIPVLLIMSFFLGVRVFLIGIVFFGLDILVVLVFEYRLQIKSFSEIVKGEH